VTTSRRAVRATARFFEDLNRQLPGERGPNGEPSTNDFQVFDLLRIVETFATPFAIVLDANVVSELMRAEPADVVVDGVDRRPAADVDPALASRAMGRWITVP